MTQTSALSLLELEAALRLAELDSRVVGVLINNIGSTQQPIPRTEELSASLERLRALGKRVVAYNSDFVVTPSQYMLAAACQQFYSIPAIVYPFGFSLTGMYLKGKCATEE
jgi:hypothetical protein